MRLRYDFAARCDMPSQSQNRNEALGAFTTASPPDVRRGSAPPVAFQNILGTLPLLRSVALLCGAEPGSRAQPTFINLLSGGAEPRLTSGGEAVAAYFNNDLLGRLQP